MPSKKISISGMHCASCEILIGKELKKISGITDVQISHKTGIANISYTNTPPSEESIKEAVKNAGYTLGTNKTLPWLSQDKQDYENFFKAAAIFIILFLVVRMLGLTDLAVNTESKSVSVALLVGLVAGLSTCMALIGGLVLALAARHSEQHPEATRLQKFRPHLFFNFGRIVGYSFFGGLIGLLGTAIKPSSTVLGVITLIIAFVMIFLGLKLVDLFPRLKNKSITLPSGIAKIFGLDKNVKEYNHFAATMTGALTFFVPCGFTQAMQIYAISSGSFTRGALIMGLFALGTSLGLLGIAGLSSVFKGQRARIFFMVSGITVILFGLTNFNNAKLLLSKATPPVPQAPTTITNGEIQEIRMTQSARGYSPNKFTLEKGKKVRWIITSTNPYTCASSIIVPKYGIERDLQSGENIIEFTPTEAGNVPFSCSMGMYRGSFQVVE
jgi:sulfite exporter TauE/SafE/copper chaperone CopZ